MRAESIGTSVRAATKEHISEKATTTESCLNITPDIPRIKTSGRKTTTVVRVLAMMASVTSSVPSIAACSCACCVSRMRKIFSRTTIALSTSIPTPRASPPKVIRLRVKPLKYNRAKVAIMEMGIAVAIITVLRTLRRNTSSMITAKIPP